MALVGVTANQASVLIRASGEFCLLISSEQSPLGKRVNYLLSCGWHKYDIYVVFYTPESVRDELRAWQALGATRLPELRHYRDGLLLRRLTGLTEIERFGYHGY